MTSRGANLATAIVSIVLISRAVRPGNQTAKVLQAATEGFSKSISAATGKQGIREWTPAERFHFRAMEAIDNFWSEDE